MSIPFISQITAILLVLGRILLGGIFVYASWDKILNPAAFADIVNNYQILPTVAVNLTALILPWVEMVCGLCLIANWQTRGSALIVAAMMLVFMAAMGINIHRGIDFTCGCFTLTGTATQSMWLYMVRDIVLLLLAIAILVVPKAHQPVTWIFKANHPDGETKNHAA